jgi:hypothetical protein
VRSRYPGCPRSRCRFASMTIVCRAARLSAPSRSPEIDSFIWLGPPGLAGRLRNAPLIAD